MNKLKCTQCNEESEINFNYCPYCGCKLDNTHEQAKKKEQLIEQLQEACFAIINSFCNLNKREPVPEAIESFLISSGFCKWLSVNGEPNGESAKYLLQNQNHCYALAENMLLRLRAIPRIQSVHAEQDYKNWISWAGQSIVNWNELKFWLDLTQRFLRVKSNGQFNPWTFFLSTAAARDAIQAKSTMSNYLALNLVKKDELIKSVPRFLDYAKKF